MISRAYLFNSPNNGLAQPEDTPGIIFHVLFAHKNINNRTLIFREMPFITIRPGVIEVAATKLPANGILNAQSPFK